LVERSAAVPYRDSYDPDLLSGRVQIVFCAIPPAIQYIRTGKLRALAVTTAARLVEALPDIPTVAEFVPSFEATGWNGIGAPKTTPAGIIDKLNKEINLGDPDK
jgi:tripartite-type tricarboxylate transporter receptor subunit TctC